MIKGRNFYRSVSLDEYKHYEGFDEIFCHREWVEQGLEEDRGGIDFRGSRKLLMLEDGLKELIAIMTCQEI